MPGEDPLLAGDYGAHFVKAMQARSADGHHQRVVCAPKHWLDYDMEGRHDAFSPQWGPSRNDFNAVVSKQEQMEYQPTRSSYATLSPFDSCRIV